MAPPTTNLQALSAIRLLVGASCLATPVLTTKVFRLTPVTGASILLCRLVGARELILGSLLWTADSSGAQRQSILASLVADNVDLLSIGVGLLEGSLEHTGGALVGVVLGLVGLRSLGGNQWEGQAATLQNGDRGQRAEGRGQRTECRKTGMRSRIRD